ncbi:MAG: DNA repair protein RecN [Deltaproteobacteria bacterium]|jgi:DNA repair protein RecN (Recombination protein N)|nr:DNA repair protein RecN [Deltaproteobacteria bacterium]
MLKELSIRNFAIIDDLQIGFSDGLTILSGETGAGKSIILNAVNLLLGSRATTDLVRSGAESAELEALFYIAASSRVAKMMIEHGYEPSDGLLVRRIIARQDTNRVYLNDRMATIQLLTAITEHLASISGQHAHQLLLKEEQHLFILDQFGGLLPLRKAVGTCFQKLLTVLKKLKKLKVIEEQQAEHMELLVFQHKEITSANPFLGEDEELEQEKMRLKNAETLYQTVYNSIETLYSAPGSVMEKLVTVNKELTKISQIDERLKSDAQNLSEATYQIEDLVEGLRGYLNSIQMDDKQLEAVEERLDTLNKLKRKYGGTLETVIAKSKSITQELAHVENVAERIKEIQNEANELHHQPKELALELSAKRKKAASGFAEKVMEQLATLKMAKTKFRVALQPIPVDAKTDPLLTVDDHMITENGIDQATFLIAPNVGEALKALASIASGGELSRVILALKALLAKSDSVETVVFDEVDAGIGGGVAEAVGKKLADLARHHQVICITHLPQIAKFGQQHFRIAKKVSSGRTRTTIQLLNDDDRYKEIARMLGGEKITQMTLAHARELLERGSNQP